MVFNSLVSYVRFTFNGMLHHGCELCVLACSIFLSGVGCYFAIHLKGQLRDVPLSRCQSSTFGHYSSDFVLL